MHRGDRAGGVEGATATELADAVGAIVIETGGAVAWLSHAVTRTRAAKVFNGNRVRSRGPLR
jgi:hypothetical protein